MLCGVSFSASYQLVAHFANKNTISLGLGCVASGLVVLGLETVLEIGPSPSHMQLTALFEACAGELSSSPREQRRILPAAALWGCSAAGKCLCSHRAACQPECRRSQRHMQTEPTTTKLQSPWLQAAHCVPEDRPPLTWQTHRCRHRAG